jgi:YD repeat-containing protein
MPFYNLPLDRKSTKMYWQIPTYLKLYYSAIDNIYYDLGRVSISRTNVKQFSDGTIDRTNAQELKYIYDSRGNVVKTIFADGTFITADYDEQGQKISETNQLGQTRYFEYNTKGQLIAVVLPAVFDPISGKSVSPRIEGTAHILFCKGKDDSPTNLRHY